MLFSNNSSSALDALKFDAFTPIEHKYPATPIRSILHLFQLSHQLKSVMYGLKLCYIATLLQVANKQR